MIPVPIPTKTDFGHTAKALVEKISGGFGRAYGPLEKILNAFADRKVAEINAVTKVTIAEAERRAIDRLLREARSDNENLESIYGKTFALTEGKTDVETIQKMSDDWIRQHAEYARLF